MFFGSVGCLEGYWASILSRRHEEDSSGPENPAAEAERQFSVSPLV